MEDRVIPPHWTMRRLALVAAGAIAAISVVVVAVLELWPALFPPPPAEIPPLSNFVVDTTGTLRSDQIDQMAQRLKQLQSDSGAQLRVLLVDTTGDDSIEAYALRVFEVWQLGRKHIDDGVLLVIAIDDRKLRIEVGYGLEGALPDAICKRIIEERITPRFKQADYARGIDQGLQSLEALIRKEPLPPVASEDVSWLRSPPLVRQATVGFLMAHAFVTLTIWGLGFPWPPDRRLETAAMQLLLVYPAWLFYYISYWQNWNLFFVFLSLVVLYLAPLIWDRRQRRRAAKAGDRRNHSSADHDSNLYVSNDSSWSSSDAISSSAASDSGSSSDSSDSGGGGGSSGGGGASGSW